MDVQLNLSPEPITLVPLLMDADEVVSRIEQIALDERNTSYAITLNGAIIGAAVMCWEPDESELIYIAIEAEHQGRGYGKTVISQLIEEARHRGVKALVVGTANSSLSNIAFYQKCGFRIDSVRKDYFAYFPAPVYDNGILIRDMLMFRLVIHE
jgi:ribosomal protein S18 acetylase RimI-like enzyme